LGKPNLWKTYFEVGGGRSQGKKNNNKNKVVGDLLWDGRGVGSQILCFFLFLLSLADSRWQMVGIAMKNAIK